MGNYILVSGSTKMLKNFNLISFMPNDLGGHWREVRGHELNRGRWSQVLLVLGHDKQSELRFVDRKPPFLEMHNCCDVDRCQSDLLSQVWFSNNVHHNTRSPIKVGEMIDFQIDGGELGLQKGWSAFNTLEHQGLWTISDGDDLVHLNSRQLLDDGRLYSKYSISDMDGNLLVNLDRVYKRVDVPAHSFEPGFAFNCRHYIYDDDEENSLEIKHLKYDLTRLTNDRAPHNARRDVEAILQHNGRTYEVNDFEHSAFYRFTSSTTTTKGDDVIAKDFTTLVDHPNGNRAQLVESAKVPHAMYLDDHQKRSYLQRHADDGSEMMYSHPCWNNKNVKSILPCILRHKKKRKNFLK